MPIIVETGPAHSPTRNHPLTSPAQVGLSHMQAAPSFGHLSYRITRPYQRLWLNTIALSSVLHDGIPIMELMDKLKDRGYDLISTKIIVYCKTIEDKSGALEIARLPKIRTRTKAINVIYHHIREYLRLGMIKIYPISTNDQVTAMFTKPLIKNSFVKHRIKVCGS